MSYSAAVYDMFEIAFSDAVVLGMIYSEPIPYARKLVIDEFTYYADFHCPAIQGVEKPRTYEQARLSQHICTVELYLHALKCGEGDVVALGQRVYWDLEYGV